MSNKLSSLSLLSIPGQTAEEMGNDYGKLADKTYDDLGQVFKILHINTDKLPRLIEQNEMKVKIPSTLHSPAGDNRGPPAAINQDHIFWNLKPK